VDSLTHSYCINYLKFNETACTAILTLFTPVIENFYMADLISQNSAVMGETSIFLNPLTPKYFNTTK